MQLCAIGVVLGLVFSLSLAAANLAKVKEMGLDKVDEKEMLKLDRGGLPEETQIVLLELKSKDE